MRQGWNSSRTQEGDSRESELLHGLTSHAHYTRSVESRVTVSRTSPDDVKQRQIIVKLDGKRLGELMHGDEISRVH